MKHTFFVRLVLLNTFKKKLRAGLVIGGIAITSSVMIMLFGISSGMKTLVNSEIANSDSKGVVTVDERNVAQIKLNEEKISDIQSISGVGAVEDSVGLVGNVIYHGVALNVPNYGVSKDFFTVSPAKFAAGDGSNLTGNNVIVSTKALDAWGLSPSNAIGKQLTNAVTVPKVYDSKIEGDSILLAPQTVTIVGVIDKSDVPVVYVAIGGMFNQGLDSVSQLKIRLADPSRELAVRESIEQMGFQTSSVQDSIDQINKVFTVIHKVLVAFAFIVFFITVSGTFTIISLTLMEEMKQIGFLRISGLKNSDVRVLFVMQSIILTSLGAFFGILGGVFGGEVINGLAQSAASSAVFTGKVALFNVPAFQIAAVLVLSVGIGWLVGLFPARRAVTIQPLEELKL